MRQALKYIILPLLLLLAYIAYSELNEPHSFTEQECFRCHKSPYDNPYDLVNVSVTQMCAPCHRIIVKTATHPVEVYPVKVKVPSDLPLQGGKITCVTCHDIHTERHEFFGFKTYQLRRPDSDIRFFCIACHERDFGSLGHAELTDVAHVGRYYRELKSDAEIDALSAQCISCHDDTFAVGASFKVGAGEWSHGFGSHPIGVDYRGAAIKNHRLAPLHQVDGRIHLFGGKIGCGTCHDMFSPLPGRLTMSNSGSRLCRECHYLY